MRINYYEDVDQLAIRFTKGKSACTKEIAEGVIVDWDKNGKLIGMDIEHASKKVDVKQMFLNDRPAVTINTEAPLNPFRAIA